MKKNMTIAVVVVSLVFASMLFVNAMTSNIMRINVPFAFQVGKVSLPAGAYTVEIQRTSSAAALGTMVVFRSADGKIQHLFGSQPESGSNAGSSLTFNKYDNAYFLAGVDLYELRCALSKGPAEKELASKGHAHRTVAVTAE